MSQTKLYFLYRILFPDGKLIEYPISLDDNDNYLPHTDITPQSWSKLGYQQCPNCTLKKKSSPYCPIALNLIPLLDLCSDQISYQNIRLEVVTTERSYTAETTMQRALSSILGLIIATSPCPHTKFLKPMAHFHLPLANNEETIYRVTSMYLLAQYFRRKDRLDFNLELDQLKVMYQNLQIVDKALANRLRAAVTEDATLNAVVLLHLLTQTINWSIDESLEEIKYLFKS